MCDNRLSYGIRNGNTRLSLRFTCCSSDSDMFMGTYVRHNNRHRHRNSFYPDSQPHTGNMVCSIHGMLTADRGKFDISESCRFKYRTAAYYHDSCNSCFQRLLWNNRTSCLRTCYISAVYAFDAFCE